MEEIIELDYRQTLESVSTLTEAMVRCFALAGMEPQQAAWEMGIDYCHFSRMIRPTDSRNFPPDLIVKAMQKAGNKFPLHWLAFQMGEATYPLEMISILKGIKEALEKDGKPVRFSLYL